MSEQVCTAPTHKDGRGMYGTNTPQVDKGLAKPAKLMSLDWSW